MRKSGEAAESGWLAAAPAVFVLIWSTGFIVARYGMPHAPPLGFLAVRYALSVLAFLVWVTLARAAWPQGRAQWGHLAVAGVLMHAGYLGGVWAAVKIGLGAGTVALIVGLQPVLTAVWVSVRGREPAGPPQGRTPEREARRHTDERVNPRQWLGLGLGFAGLLLVVERKLQVGEVTLANVALALFALASITVGTLYQKRHVVPGDVRSANCVQLIAALAVTAPLAVIEGGSFDPHPELIGAMAWSVLVLTLGGSSLLTLLIQRGAATRVTGLLYLVPPCTALMAWLLFREPLTAGVLAGVALTAAGVALVVRENQPPSGDKP